MSYIPTDTVSCILSEEFRKPRTIESSRTTSAHIFFVVVTGSGGMTSMMTSKRWRKIEHFLLRMPHQYYNHFLAFDRVNPIPKLILPCLGRVIWNRIIILFVSSSRATKLASSVRRQQNSPCCFVGCILLFVGWIAASLCGQRLLLRDLEILHALVIVSLFCYVSENSNLEIVGRCLKMIMGYGCQQRWICRPTMWNTTRRSYRSMMLNSSRIS